MFPISITAQAANEFTVAHSMTTDHIFHNTSQWLEEELEKRGSTLKMNYHPAGDLGDWTSLFEQNIQGVIPMVMGWPDSAFDPRLDLAYLAYVVDDWETATKVYGPAGKMLNVYTDILAQQGLIVLGTIPTGFGSVAIRKGAGKLPVNFPEDAKGIKVRVPGLKIAEMRFNAFGFSAVPIPFSELYTALQLGTVDGRTFGPPVEIWQMRDVLEAYILTRDFFEHAFLTVNKDWWDDLGSEEQKILREASDAALARAWKEAEALGDNFLEKVRGHGIQVVELTPEQLNKAKEIVYETEWPFMESIVGSEIMDEMRAVAGIK
ncbi:C4-dicarboxylate ABC transporter substrate-binding protein [Kiloniella spongiae]|uniref:C4-dicarboxylate ABC transporter substrate-binding protein n=1 Tax=Kiloniella spongiae TaxID=1489064 RepID=A0A0H2M8Y3_9PROT|nr:C4-dicarboxylate ABC transporter substrate-binding protein [Kiloniella spongiae]